MFKTILEMLKLPYVVLKVILIAIFFREELKVYQKIVNKMESEFILGRKI